MHSDATATVLLRSPAEGISDHRAPCTVNSPTVAASNNMERLKGNSPEADPELTETNIAQLPLTAQGHFSDSSDIDMTTGSTAMTDLPQELTLSLRKQRRNLAKLFSVKLHPTASTILDEGAKAILAGGGGAVTMRTVAKQSSIKLASLQYHFKTFDQLISALFSREFGTITDLIWNVFENVEASRQTPVATLRSAVESFMPNDKSSSPIGHRIYFHLVAYTSYNSDALLKAKEFYRFFNTLIAYLISKVNTKLVLSECLARATMITSALEGSCIYTILRAGGVAAERVIHQEIGNLAIHYATLPSSAERSRTRRLRKRA